MDINPLLVRILPDTEDRVKRLEELAEQARSRTRAERPTSKELFMHVRSNTLEKVKTLTRKVRPISFPLIFQGQQ
jgi:hypothetical protein